MKNNTHAFVWQINLLAVHHNIKWLISKRGNEINVLVVFVIASTRFVTLSTPAALHLHRVPSCILLCSCIEQILDQCRLKRIERIHEEKSTCPEAHRRRSRISRCMESTPCVCSETRGCLCRSQSCRVHHSLKAPRLWHSEGRVIGAPSWLKIPASSLATATALI